MMTVRISFQQSLVPDATRVSANRDKKKLNVSIGCQMM